MNNVERVTYYGDLPQEAAPTLPTDPPADWPQHGHLKFSNVQMRYREGLPLVLKGVSFEAMPGEKVGSTDLSRVQRHDTDMRALHNLTDWYSRAYWCW